MSDPLMPVILPNEPAEAEVPARADPKPFTIATISAGFEKGDFLVREEQGARIYFDFVSMNVKRSGRYDYVISKF
jgi:hypothetical protein